MSGGFVEDRLPLLVRSPARCTARRCTGPWPFGNPSQRNLLELARLAVRQGVHRVDDDRLDALAAAAPQDVVDDRDDVGEALARAGAGRQDVVAALWRPCGSPLPGAGGSRSGTPLESSADLLRKIGRSRVEDALLDEVRQRARLERRVQLDQGLGPEHAVVEELVDVLADPRVADLDEAADVGRVVSDQSVADGEGIHSTTPVA